MTISSDVPAKRNWWTRPIGLVLIGVLGIAVGAAVSLAIAEARISELNAQHASEVADLESELAVADVTIAACQDAIAVYQQITMDITTARNMTLDAFNIGLAGDRSGAAATLASADALFGEAKASAQQAGGCG